MNKTQTIILLFILLILQTQITTATTITENITYNISDLPANGILNFNFSLAPNETIYFSEIENDPRTTISYINQTTLNENTSIANLDVHYTIPFFTDYSDNYTLIEDIIGVTNSVNENLILLKLNYKILHPPLWNQTNTSEPYLLLSDAGKRVEIHTFSAIQFDQAHEIKVKAPNGAIINVTCGEFINCPEQKTVLENDEVSIIANISVPKGQIGGNYSSYVTVETGNISGTVNFTIIVRVDDIAELIRYDIWDESCYDSPEKLAECYKLQARYNSEVANALLQRLKDGEHLCEDTHRLNETTKYVEVGNIDPELLKDNQQLRTKFNTLSLDYSELSSEYTSCMSKKSDLETQVQQETEDLSNDFILKRSDLERDTIEKEIKLRQDFKNKMNWLLGILFFFFVITYITGCYLESQWVIQTFPKKLIGLISLIILTGWILFAIIM